MTTWIFGDSFSFTSEEWQQLGVPTWPQLMADLLQMNVTNVSCPGSSQDFSISQAWQHRDQFRSGDVIIWVATDHRRFWLWEDQPWACNLSTVEVLEHSSKVELTAMKLWSTTLNQPHLQHIWIEQRLSTLAYLAQIKDLRVLVLPAWDLPRTQPCEQYQRVDVMQGCLFNVQQREWAGTYDPKTFELIPELQYMAVNWNNTDLRYNHLSLDNHSILAGKIADWYHHGSVPDEQGFRRDLWWLCDNANDLDWSQLDPDQRPGLQGQRSKFKIPEWFSKML